MWANPNTRPVLRFRHLADSVQVHTILQFLRTIDGCEELPELRRRQGLSECISKIGCRRYELDGQVLELRDLLSDAVVRDVDVSCLLCWD